MKEMKENRILDILQTQGRSIYWLAHKVEMSYNAIHRLVKCPIIPDGTSYGTLRSISGALDVRVADLEKE